MLVDDLLNGSHDPQGPDPEPDAPVCQLAVPPGWGGMSPLGRPWQMSG